MTVDTFDLNAKRRWANAQFDRDGEPSLGAILKHLGEEDFVPSGTAREAIRTLIADETAAATDPLGEYAAALEMKNNEDIEAFAGEYFSLFVGDRIRRLEDLRSREGQTASQRERLAELSKAAYVNPQPKPSDDPRVAQLAALIGELFLLPPVVRAPRIRAELSKMNASGGEWAAAANQLQRADSGIANLLPRFTREVVELHPARQHERRKQQQQLRAAAEPQPALPWTEEPKSEESSWLWVGLAVVGLVVGIGLMDRDRSTDNSGRYRQPNDIPLPPLKTFEVDPVRFDGRFNRDRMPMSPKEKKQFEEAVRATRILQGLPDVGDSGNPVPRKTTADEQIPGKRTSP